jgi:hypothetical protein
MTLASGTRLGHYEIRSKIGAGGMVSTEESGLKSVDRKVVRVRLAPSASINSMT